MGQPCSQSGMVPDCRAAVLLLRSPSRFFDERPPADTLPIATALVFLLAVGLVVGLLLTGSLLAGSIDATVRVDNPDRPPEVFCNGNGPASTEHCDEPATVPRDAGTLVENAVRKRLWIGLVAPFVLWFLGAVALYGGARLAGGTPSFEGTLAVSGWAALPERFRLAVGLVGRSVVRHGVTITDPERALAVVQTAVAPVRPVIDAVTIATAGWQWVLLSGGLGREADLPWKSAAICVGVPLALVVLLGLT